ncbi:LysR family transcriptional regulator [Longispora albida]|uniref:LysR family transcriptional regulator n=1 Tax=Longispora albida TaxID=203523 RepID=UPI0003757CAC|nr:LysR family transcriptional regulator [Longispora albida]
MELEVRHLRLLCAIAEHGSLTRAAAALRLTQPGLSAQLKRIERMIGGALFVRDVRGAVPTALGELVLSRARAVLPALDDLRAVTTAAPPGSGHVLRLGTVNSPLFGRFVRGLRELFPAVTITTRAESSSAPLADLVGSGHLELAVLGDSPGYELAPRPGLVLHPVAAEPLFALLPASHPLAAGPEVTLAELAGIEWTLPPRDDDRIHEYYTSVLDRLGVEPRITHQVEGTVVFDLIREAGVASLCQAACREPPGVAVRPITGDPLWYRQVLAWHARGPVAGHEEQVIELASRAQREAARRSPAYTAWLSRAHHS